MGVGSLTTFVMGHVCYGFHAGDDAQNFSETEGTSGADDQRLFLCKTILP